MTPFEFLQLLWRERPETFFILIWTLQGKASHWFQDIASAAGFIEKDHGTDVYVGVGISQSDNGPHHRCRSVDVAGIAGLWADFDLRSPAHSKKALPATIEDALTIVPTGLPPTITITTGNGVHAWWLFERPWIFANEDERNQASVLSSRFQTLLHYNSSQRGWAFDRLSDLARVLRIPGTVNSKDPANPKPVEVYSTEGRRYTPAEIRDYLDRLAIPDPDAQERTHKDIGERFADSPLVVNLKAEVSDDLLAGWMARDDRFRQTWHQERDDMPDRSASGYDMALACFGVTAGLSDQQIVDLIVHHRRVHGNQQRKGADYFQRTISKARKTDVTRALSARTGALGDQEHLAGDDGPAEVSGPADVTRKAKLCDQISSLLGVSILRLVKVPGREPVYLMELEGGRIDFDIRRLTTQASVKLALAASVGKIIPTLKTQRWQELTQMMLDACTVVETTDDLEFEGSARIQIDKYLSENPFIGSLKGATVQDCRKPFIWKDEITISTLDLQAHINRTTMQNYSVQHIAAMLNALGARAVRVRGGSFKEQSRWALPVDEFAPQDYAQPYPEDDGDAA